MRAPTYSTKTPTPSSVTQSTRDDESIFSPAASSWDHVFDSIKDVPLLLPSSSRGRPPPQGASGREPHQQTMTAREISAFDEMFNMIFSAVAEQNMQTPGKKPHTLSAAVGVGRTGIRETTDIFGKLHSQSKTLRWPNEADEELDRKKEQMELCNSDQQLLDWAMREVFGESKRYEEEARRALEDPKSSGKPVQLQLQPPSYPYLIALLMKTFRERYADPHLALSIFDHARHLSIPSFVFGCTTPAYNELIETRWRCFRDLRGVCDALEEMWVNVVRLDNRTRALAEMIRQDVGERTMWQEENPLRSGEVREMLAKIEDLSTRTRPYPGKKTEPLTPKLGKKRWRGSQEWKRNLQPGTSMRVPWEDFGEWPPAPERTTDADDPGY
ncbi:uncharacterized protein LAESUDRAFT_703222 [Laetiporus sulphureus 93-53]|uniref:Mtf2-like C-terminal domain-containing protein n=1 Tax=Laetiporus sulphureus 93-53 TaxID=1314785 RepID=A0A165DD25_9APHY|nr:uncharacterized protein LAESUDRAFT_703222 [Laetiporus sulphureus 93-53]KZT04601.1 hypothetical protein LAESUDRAFT_703222 [Laetiporus sulphureus 93-53]